MEQYKQNPKKLFINLYDNYSISSTLMQLQTYNQVDNANYLNQNFYCINLNIKSMDSIEFLGQTFINENASHGYHQLPIALLNGKMSSPAFIIFDENSKFLGREQRYFSPEDFEILIRFVGNNAYRNQTIEEYRKEFKSTMQKTH
jgi:thioredoxin-related protein